MIFMPLGVAAFTGPGLVSKKMCHFFQIRFSIMLQFLTAMKKQIISTGLTLTGSQLEQGIIKH